MTTRVCIVCPHCISGPGSMSDYCPVCCNSGRICPCQCPRRLNTGLSIEEIRDLVNGANMSPEWKASVIARFEWLETAFYPAIGQRGQQ
jgi:hypothetical protein